MPPLPNHKTPHPAAPGQEDTMDFPGDNKISLTRETVTAIIRTHLAGLFGDGVRITAVENASSYSPDAGALKITFTSDAPAAEQVSE